MNKLLKPVRTQAQAYERVLDHLNAGMLGATGHKMWYSFFGSKRKVKTCVYSQGDKACGVGCLLSHDQQQDLIKRKYNAATINTLIEVIGKDNIVHATGLNVKQLTALQSKHDSWANSQAQERISKDEFRAYVNQRLKAAQRLGR